MHDPIYLLHISEGPEEISELLHQDIVNRLVERMMARIGRGDIYLLTAVDKWQIEVLQDAGYLREDIMREIAKRTKRQQTEIAEAMEDAGVRTLSYDDALYKAVGLSPTPLTQSPYLMRLMQRNYEATMGEWRNFTRTTADAAQQAFIRACDKAYHLTASGAVSYTQAVKEAVNDIASNGVVVRYPSGHTDTIETATLRAVRTGISQASAQIQTARMDEMDVDLVLVSSHLGARPSHAEWQGKIYSRSGKDPKYPDFVKSTRYGSVDGLCGANCRHSFGPYFEGMDNPFEQYDSAENKKAYEIQQRQRALERRIRKTKREVMGLKTAVDNADDPELKIELENEYGRKSLLLQKQNKAYNDFCEQNNLKRLNERVQIARWNRKQSAAARTAKIKLEKKANSLYNLGSTELNVEAYTKHSSAHAEMEAHGIQFKEWINETEAVVDAGHPKVKSETIHAIENREIKSDRADMNIETAQRFVDNAKVVIFQSDRHNTKFLADEGYTILNHDGVLVTAVPQKWRKKYDKYLEEKDGTSK